GQAHHPRPRERLLRRLPRDRRPLDGHRGAVDHRLHRSVRVRQV
ncbi:MAG: Phosphate transport ATP-binding protein PstB, partial [uncultured Friedmanniella sp.]